MSESKKPVSPKSALAVVVIAALLYGGNLVREKWFGGTTPGETTKTNDSGKKAPSDADKRVAANSGSNAKKGSSKSDVKSSPKNASSGRKTASKQPVADKKKASTPTKTADAKKTSTKTAAAKNTSTKKKSRFSQERKSRFPRNQVGRGAPSVKWGGIDEVKRAFQQKRSDVFVEVTGRVVHILPLDTVGSRHQNFLLELANKITLKISHNIDLAPMIPNLRKGMTLRVRGEYEYNDKGGVVHWTHHDPARRHPDGWIEVNGKKYG